MRTMKAKKPAPLLLWLCLLQLVSSFTVQNGRLRQKALLTIRGPVRKTPIENHACSSLFLSSASPAPSSAVSSQKQKRKKRLAAGMAFLTAWSDIEVFLKYETFATMMTGNYLWMTKALVERNYTRLLYYASVIVAYLFGVASFRRCDLDLRKETLHVCSIAVALLFFGSDIIFNLSGGSRWIPVLLLSTGFGIINSIGNEVAGTMTFVVTGHMTKLTRCFVDRFSRTRGRQRLDWNAIVQSSPVMLGFMLGGLWACFLRKGLAHAVRGNVFSIIGGLYGLLFYWLDMESFGGAWWLRKDGAMCELDDDGESCIIPQEEDMRVSEKSLS